jgi:predicted naringenin-chalcone synthase
MQTKILSTARQLPKYYKDTEEIIHLLNDWLKNEPERFRRKISKIYEMAQVDRRYSVVQPELAFSDRSFEERNTEFVREAINLSCDALEKALNKARLQPGDIDMIISVCCTGFMIPSVDAYVINKLGMRQDIVRLPVTEMGCAAGISALIYGSNYLKNNPGKKVAIIAVESPVSTLINSDLSMTNMVSSAIFGDGVAAVILGDGDEPGFHVRDGEMYHFYDEQELMGFTLVNEGLKMVLDKSVPDRIEEHFDNIIFPFLEKNELGIADIDHFIFHPGGKKIIRITEQLLSQYGQNIDLTKQILREYGNMSSATVLYVLDELLDNPKYAIQDGDYGLMLSFGPGFSAQRILLQWQA